MIISKTKEYFNYINKETIIIKYETIIDIIILKFNESNKYLKEIENLQNFQYLPSFSGRKEKTRIINEKRLYLQLLIKEIKKLISNLEYKNRINNCLKNINKESECCKIFKGDCFKILFPKQLEKNIINFLNQKYKNLLLNLKSLEQNYLFKVKDIAIFDEIEQSIELKRDVELKIIETNLENKQIKDSIFNINILLHDLKTHLISHEFEIDRVDVYINSINKNLENTNKEVIKYKKRHKDSKDRIIILLIFICLSLFACLVFKYERRNIKKIQLKKNNEFMPHEQPERDGIWNSNNKQKTNINQ